MPFPPGLFLIGAQKAGTTFLANLLAQHPDVCLAEPKEPHYFTQNLARGPDWYERRFARPEARYLLDASPSYSAAPLPCFDDPPSSSMPYRGVPERIADLSPDAKILYLVRDPVKRTYSSYMHNVRAGHERLSFREALDRKSYYLRMSRYYDQLGLYFERFSRDSVLVLLFEDLVRDPRGAAQRCFGFLGLPADVPVEVEVGRNSSFVYRPAVAAVNRSLSRWGGVNRALKPLKRALPESLVATLSGLISKRVPKLEQADRDYLASYFEPENEKLARGLGLSLDAWGGVRAA